MTADWIPLSCREGNHRTDTVDGACVCGAVTPPEADDDYGRDRRWLWLLVGLSTLLGFCLLGVVSAWALTELMDVACGRTPTLAYCVEETP